MLESHRHIYLPIQLIRSINSATSNKSEICQSVWDDTGHDELTKSKRERVMVVWLVIVRFCWQLEDSSAHPPHCICDERPSSLSFTCWDKANSGICIWFASSGTHLGSSTNECWDLCPFWDIKGVGSLGYILPYYWSHYRGLGLFTNRQSKWLPLTSLVERREGCHMTVHNAYD